MVKTGALGSKKDESEYVKQVSGLAKIKSGDEQCEVTFLETTNKFGNGEVFKKFALDDLPKFPKIHPQTEATYKIRLQQDALQIESIFPANGRFQAILVDMGRRPEQDAAPIPYEGKPYKEGMIPPMMFFAVYKITAGPMKGAQAPYFLHYKFMDDGQGMTTFKGDADNVKATRLHQLIDWANRHGLIDDVIQWPEDGNILPVLLNRALEKKVTVNLEVKNGWISELVDADNYGPSEEEQGTPATKSDDDSDL